MSRPVDKEVFRDLFQGFAVPLSGIDCGKKCGPFNDYGVPVCCDIHRVVPAAFEQEWCFLKENSDLWQPWSSSGLMDQSLEDEVQDGQVLLKCKGYKDCQRDFRTITCRAFPFYPYLNSQGEFSGLAYYPDFREECWMISNLDLVSQSFKEAFRDTFQQIFSLFPDYHQDFAGYCSYIRESAAAAGEKITLLGFSGNVILVDPQTEEEFRVEYNELGAFGPYAITRELQFPDEIQSQTSSEK